MGRGDGVEIISDIDTENELRSVVKILPIPDSVINKSDLRHIAGFYREIDDEPSGDHILRYAPLNGLGGQGQQAWNVM